MLIEEKNRGIELTGQIEYEVSSDEEETAEKEEKVKKLELSKVEVSELAKQLKTLENQMVHGGNLVDSVKENETKLEQQRLEIAARKVGLYKFSSKNREIRVLDALTGV